MCERIRKIEGRAAYGRTNSNLCIFRGECSFGSLTSLSPWLGSVHLRRFSVSLNPFYLQASSDLGSSLFARAQASAISSVIQMQYDDTTASSRNRRFIADSSSSTANDCCVADDCLTLLGDDGQAAGIITGIGTVRRPGISNSTPWCNPSSLCCRSVPELQKKYATTSACPSVCAQ